MRWPLHINLNRMQRENIQQDILLLCVLEGKVELSIEGEKYLMNVGDMIAINSVKKYSWIAQEETHLIAQITISYQLLSDYLKNDIVYFWCNSVEEHTPSYETLKQYIYKLLYEYVLDTQNMTFAAQSIYYQIIDFMLIAFLVKNDFTKRMDDKEEIVYRTVQYINMHYDEKLSLEEIAGELYTNPASLSRLFKKRVGMNFVEYANSIRMQRAVDELLFTEKPVTIVAADSGFSNISLFNRMFKKRYNTTPSEFRRQMKGNVENHLKEKEQKEYDRVKQFVDQLRQNKITEAGSVMEISVDMAASGQKARYGCEAINMGSASQLLMAEVQKHAMILKKELEYKYLLIKNIMSADMQIRDTANAENLNFDRVDTVLDFLVENRIVPILEFGEEPDRIQKNINEVIVKNRNDVFFQDEDDSNFVISKFIQHILTRYGSAEVGEWLFQCTYEEHADKKYPVNQYNYVNIIENLILTIRNYIPAAKIGVFGHEISTDNYIILNFLEQWKQKEILPDFLLINLRPYAVEHGQYKYIPYPEYIRIELQKTRKLLKEYGFEKIGLFLNDWNTTMSDRNYVNDTCAKGAYIVKAMLLYQQDADMIIYDYGSDILSIHYDKHSLLTGGKGLLTKDGIRKPACYAFSFLKRINGDIISKGEQYIASCNRKGDYYILLSNPVNFSYRYFMKKEDEWERHEIAHLFEHRGIVKVNLHLFNLDNEKYSLRQYTVNDKYVNLIEEWKCLGDQEIQTREEIEYLSNITVPRLSVTHNAVKRNYLNLSLYMEPHEVVFIHMHKDKL